MNIQLINHYTSTLLLYCYNFAFLTNKIPNVFYIFCFQCIFYSCFNLPTKMKFAEEKLFIIWIYVYLFMCIKSTSTFKECKLYCGSMTFLFFVMLKRFQSHMSDLFFVIISYLRTVECKTISV